MIDHLSITVSSLRVSRMFYQAALAPLGYEIIMDVASSVSFGIPLGQGADVKHTPDPAGDFWLSEAAPMVPRPHFAFSANSRALVNDFFTAGLEAGGTDNGTPGLRPNYHPHYYAAFLFDPDGYNIEAVCHSEGP